MASEPWPKVHEYRLALTIDPAALAFSGEVEVDLEGDGGPIRLNAADLTITGARVGDRTVTPEVRAADEEVAFGAAPPGRTTVAVAFRGRVPERSLMGLYRSRFGREFLLTTQCAPTGARHIFPCIDRPDRKAPIVLTATVPSDQEVVFNTPPDDERRAGATKTVVFARTPPMATYLFYLGVGRFDAVHARTAEGTRLAVLAPLGRGGESAYALERAAKLLPAFGRYYDLPYPLPKLDLIAVPEYAYGAMENWGAIVFRDMRLLVSPATSSRQLQFTLDTIAHEIAHQWFGNLVTMRWWTDIWLNESFATWMELRMVEDLWPGTGSLENFLVYWMDLALLTDSLPSTRPITTPIRRPEEIAQAFDEITYGKGASVLRMVEAYLGRDLFRRGIADYLRRFQGANATSSDLWDALDRAAGEPIRGLLEAWVDRPGLPLVSVRTTPTGLELRQRRFAYDGRHAPGSWPIPMLLEIDAASRRWRFERAEDRLPLDAPPTSLHLNPGAMGFYRVLYDEAGYDLLARGFAERPGADQWIVLEDLYAFLHSGDASFERYASFVDAVAAGREYLPARAATEQLLDLVLHVPGHARAQALARSFLRAHAERLGPRRRADEPAVDGVLRERVAHARVWVDPEYARELAARFDPSGGVDADLRGAIEIAYARAGGPAARDGLGKALAAAPSEGEASELELALASSADPAVVADTLAATLDGRINRAHVANIVRQASYNPDGRDPTWRFLREQVERLAADTRGTGFASFVLEYAIPWVGLGRVAEVEGFFAAHPVAEGGRGLAKGLELLRAGARLADRLS